MRVLLNLTAWPSTDLSLDIGGIEGER